MLSICILGLPLGIGFYLGQVLNNDDVMSDIAFADLAKQWQATLLKQKHEITVSQGKANEQLRVIVSRLAELQARLVRLDALGERLITMAKLDKGEFDFSRPPALGGPETTELESAYQPPEFLQAVNQLVDQINDREQQLETLEALVTKRQLQDEAFIAGRPIKKGWISSRYGRRTDPFSGKIAWHNGVDFAGKSGSEIISVAAGVVVESSVRSGYGGFVEINHGSGFTTRYAHNKENLVNVGDVVKKGQIIALMGSTGRSTGPHVHFEVYKFGRPVDPSTYIRRTYR